MNAGLIAGTIISLAGRHEVEDIREVSVGLGLQVVRLVISGSFYNHRSCHSPKTVFFVRLYIDRDSEYLFITRSIEKSRQLMSTLKVFDSSAANNNCSLQR